MGMQKLPARLLVTATSAGASFIHRLCEEGSVLHPSLLLPEGVGGVAGGALYPAVGPGIEAGLFSPFRLLKAQSYPPAPRLSAGRLGPYYLAHR